ncbi:Response regulator receiver protein OS=Tsukamurella paurometabola (strain ATCC 8368 / DSM /CCUG 35730 / CIP 100753 / JCM 10117 / KCTC 9821 / NBRC 16120/ NCIMB 702349 / NCTC 13040) OX=521096 GN=Tpau_0370 PE=4 SV=1 [Tsukamurella paurometabola]|uniref:Uncharacterized protein n=1 Tax=Tsukamurella paurometabola (strain ATCC 8368 / DSM 20162 / CCUG 35730 / CIP 100753 / JCM 10117 / KCTC 9821 / NBRC 16120 / NCIMB 702349 / NCTC 13040) TaxID=521096 RepID=D5URG0_TSUPD|nr:hypothetical protein [Tsukamurella paurometabola]ADG77013.1 hypothetical protein Tpau_0370 [Tsukamurella paurometabola DSM 20162]SUP42440.1 Uncharacterised protein [Tsukamurella paurometabola]
MTVLVAAQDAAGAIAVARALDGAPAVVGADGALTPLAEQPREVDAAVYVLDACVPADPVDSVALGRLRARWGTVVAATGAEAYPDSAATCAESARRLGVAVLPVEPGLAAIRAALACAPAPEPCVPAVPARPNPALERADRSAYLRSTVARMRAALLAESAERFRGRDDDASPERVRARLERTVAGLELSLHEYLRAAYRGTFAGWPSPPEPAVPVLSRPDPTEPPAHRRRPEDAAVLVLGASAGLGIGRAVAAPLEALGTLRWLALPISLVVGLAAALWLLRVRRRTSARASRRAWSDGAAAAHRQRVEYEIAAALVAAESDAALRLARGPGTEPRPDASNGHGA